MDYSLPLKIEDVFRGVYVMQEWIKDAFQIGGTIGTLWAALSARKSAQISTTQLETQIEEKKQVDRPRLVPLNHRVSLELHSIFSDWKVEETDSKFTFKNKHKMSRFHVPLINTGNTHAFDISYSFKLLGGIDSFQEHEDNSLSLSLANPDLKQLGVENFNFVAIEYPPGNPTVYTKQEVEVIPYPQFIPLIQNNKNGEMHLPKFFIILSNIHLEEHWLQGPSINRPEAIVTIKYKDQLNVEHVDKYLMSLSKKQISTHGPEVNTWVDFQYIKPPIEQKKPTR